MRQKIKTFASRIDSVFPVCKKVLEWGEKIKAMSPNDIGMDAYAENVVYYTEERGHAMRKAIKELKSIMTEYSEIQEDEASSPAEMAFIEEKMKSLEDMSPLFAAQGTILRKSLDVHLSDLRKEFTQFHHNVGVIKNYLKTPSKRNFYN